MTEIGDINFKFEYKLFTTFINNLQNKDIKEKLLSFTKYINNIYSKIENKIISDILFEQGFNLLLHCNNLLFTIYQSLDKSNINTELIEIKTVLDKLLESGNIEKNEYVEIINTLNELIK